MANNEVALFYCCDDSECAGQLNSRPNDLYFCLCCPGNVTVWRELSSIQKCYAFSWTMWQNSSMEFLWFYAFLYDCLPCSMWRMDWIYVGLSWGKRMELHYLLSHDHGPWESSGTYKPFHCTSFIISERIFWSIRYLLLGVLFGVIYLDSWYRKFRWHLHLKRSVLLRWHQPRVSDASANKYLLVQKTETKGWGSENLWNI